MGHLFLQLENLHYMMQERRTDDFFNLESFILLKIDSAFWEEQVDSKEHVFVSLFE